MSSESAHDNVICIYNARLVDANTDCSGALILNGGIIQSVLKGDFTSRQTAAKAANICTAEPVLIDARGMTVQPAFIDMHAHFRYPGQTEKEDLGSALHAAAAGGFGTLVLMPNTSPVVSDAAEAQKINEEAAAFGLADVFQTVSLTAGFDGANTVHLDLIPPYIPGTVPETQAVPVVTEDGQDVASAAVMLNAMKICAKKNLIVSCHCEDTSLAAAAKPFRSSALASYARTQPQSVQQAETALRQANALLALAEDTATVRNIELARAAGCRIHIAHVSTAASVDAVRTAKRANQDVTCEVTPHHIALSVKTDADLRHIVNPPVRNEADRRAVIDGILDGTIDVIATDHAPHTAADKAAGAPGFTGLETAYAVCCTELVRPGLIDDKKLSELMSASPARLLGLDRTAVPKGLLSPGFAADIVIADTQEMWRVESSGFFSKGTYTPFEGCTLRGRIHAAYHRGKCVFTLKK